MPIPSINNTTHQLPTFPTVSVHTLALVPPQSLVSGIKTTSCVSVWMILICSCCSSSGTALHSSRQAATRYLQAVNHCDDTKKARTHAPTWLRSCGPAWPPSCNPSISLMSAAALSFNQNHLLLTFSFTGIAAKIATTEPEHCRLAFCLPARTAAPGPYVHYMRVSCFRKGEMPRCLFRFHSHGTIHGNVNDCSKSRGNVFETSQR